jgi:hypothetical protein
MASVYIGRYVESDAWLRRPLQRILMPPSNSGIPLNLMPPGYSDHSLGPYIQNQLLMRLEI